MNEMLGKDTPQAIAIEIDVLQMIFFSAQNSFIWYNTTEFWGTTDAHNENITFSGRIYTSR